MQQAIKYGSVDTPTDDEHRKIKRIMWGLLGSSTICLTLALASAIGGYPAKWREVLVASAATLGLPAGITQLKEKSRSAERSYVNRFNADEEARQLADIAMKTPWKAQREQGVKISAKGSVIAAVMHQQGYVGIQYRDEADAYTYIKYIFSYSAFGHEVFSSNEKTIAQLRANLKLPMQTNGEPLGITIMPVTSSGNLEVHIEKLEPEKSRPQLIEFIDQYQGFPTRLVGVDLGDNRQLKVVDLLKEDYTHELHVGASGSGKSSALIARAEWDITHNHENEVKLIFVDLKGSQTSSTFNSAWLDIPHVLLPPITDEENTHRLVYALTVLHSARMNFLSGLVAAGHIDEANINSYQKAAPGKMARIFVYIDEAATMRTAGSNNYAKDTLWDKQLAYLLAKSRSSGIHFVFGYQLADTDNLSYHAKAHCSLVTGMRTNDLHSVPIAMSAGDPLKDPAAGDLGRTAQGLAGKGEMLYKVRGNYVKLQVPQAAPNPLSLKGYIRHHAQLGGYDFWERWGSVLDDVGLTGEGMFDLSLKEIEACYHGHGNAPILQAEAFAPTSAYLPAALNDYPTPGQTVDVSAEVAQVKPSQADQAYEEGAQLQHQATDYLSLWMSYVTEQIQKEQGYRLIGFLGDKDSYLRRLDAEGQLPDSVSAKGGTDKLNQQHDYYMSVSKWAFLKAAHMKLYQGKSWQDILDQFWGSGSLLRADKANTEKSKQREKARMEQVMTWIKAAEGYNTDELRAEMVKWKLIAEEEGDE